MVLLGCATPSWASGASAIVCPIVALNDRRYPSARGAQPKRCSPVPRLMRGVAYVDHGSLTDRAIEQGRRLRDRTPDGSGRERGRSRGRPPAPAKLAAGCPACGHPDKVTLEEKSMDLV